MKHVLLLIPSLFKDIVISSISVIWKKHMTIVDIFKVFIPSVIELDNAVSVICKKLRLNIVFPCLQKAT